MTTQKSNSDEDDISFVEEQEIGSSLKSKSEKKLRDELAQCQNEKQEYLEGWQRAKADLINFRRDSDEARKKMAQLATEDLIAQLLPVLDSFDMAFRNKTAWEEAPLSWRTGIEYIYSQLLSVLQSHGLVQLNPIGETFDPRLHDSLETVPVQTDADAGKVLDVIQKGYMLYDRMIRAARVRVGEFKER
jgi:molecular chaperone GrpE